MNNNLSVEFTQEEAQVVLQLLDLAVRQGGLNVAQNALGVALRIKEAMEVPPPPPPGNGAARDTMHPPPGG